jgi:uncharacterized protein (DUF433 family)
MKTMYVGLDRITFDPRVMAGKTSIRGKCVTVNLILNLLASGMTAEEIISAYPYLKVEDISQSLRYASWLADEDDDFDQEVAALATMRSLCGSWMSDQRKQERFRSTMLAVSWEWQTREVIAL